MPENGPKNIVICSDGTGNTAIKGRGTNVFKLYEAVDLGKGGQVAVYDDGVGTEGLKFLKLLGGAFGWGLSRNVRQLYAGLMRVYEPGDKIFLFGFSRGAFTVRTLAGFIIACGILNRADFGTDGELRSAVWLTYRYQYRGRYRAVLDRLSAPRWSEAFWRWWWKVPKKEAHPGAVEFIGVWDTVDAVGLPLDEIADFINYFIYRFKFSARSLSHKVAKGCHAIAMDDERHTFHPVLWDEGRAKPGQIEQVWFPGVHSNVGGGYPKQGMSLVSLDWMMTQAEASGLHFISHDRDLYRAHQNAGDKLYNSRSGLAAYYHYRPRDIAKICGENGAAPKIHVSALERIAQATEGYAPGNLPRGLRIVETQGTGRDLGAAVQAIQSGLGAAHSPLDLGGVRRWVGVREWTQRVFAALSLAWLLGVVLLEAEAQGKSWLRVAAAMLGQLLPAPVPAALGKIRQILGSDAAGQIMERISWPFALPGELFGHYAAPLVQPLAEIARFLGWIAKSTAGHPVYTALLMLGCYVIGVWAKRRMKRAFSELWSGLVPRLRSILPGW